MQQHDQLELVCFFVTRKGGTLQSVRSLQRCCTSSFSNFAENRAPYGKICGDPQDDSVESIKLEFRRKWVLCHVERRRRKLFVKNLGSELSMNHGPQKVRSVGGNTQAGCAEWGFWRFGCPECTKKNQNKNELIIENVNTLSKMGKAAEVAQWRRSYQDHRRWSMRHQTIRTKRTMGTDVATRSIELPLDSLSLSNASPILSISCFLCFIFYQRRRLRAELAVAE